MRLLNIILILFILLFYPSGTVLSQGMPDYELKWQQIYDGGSTDTGYAIKCDDSGNVYIAGTSSSPVDGKDFLLLKYDSDGNFLWKETYGAELSNGSDNNQVAYDLTFDAQGKLYFCGTAGPDSSHSWLYKINPANRNVIFSTTTGLSSAYALAYGSDNFIYVSGNKLQAPLNNDIGITKFDTGGSITDIFISSVSLDETVTYGMSISPSGYIFVSGIQIDHLASTQDGYISEFSPTGGELINKAVAGQYVTDNEITCDLLASNNRVYTSGIFSQSNNIAFFLEFDFTLDISSYDVFSTKYNSINCAICQDQAGNIYVLNTYFNEVILRKYKAGTCSVEWAMQCVSDPLVSGTNITIDSSSNIYIVGAKNSQDIYIAKYGPKTIYLPAYSLTGTIIDSEENLPVSGVNIYISSGDITISTKTNDSGTYIFENVDMATYSVIPSRVNYEFIPASATVYLSENTVLNFSAVLVIPPTYYLSGIIKDVGGNPLENITVYIASRTSIDTFTDFESTVTDSSGRYEFQNLIKNNYRVCPVKDGYGFSPAQYYYSSLREIKEFQNFMMINWDIKQNEIKTNFVRPINNVINPKDNKPVIVQYNLAESGYTKIGIYTLEGALVKLLVDEYRYAGPGTAEWYCENAVNEIVSSGIYLVRVETPKNTLIKKICVIK